MPKIAPSIVQLSRTKGSSMTNPSPAAMQAVVCHGPKDYRLETIPTPVAGPHELVIQI